MMHGAIYDTVNSIAPSTHRPYLISVPALPGASIRAAVAHAAHDTLVVAFPSQAAFVTAQRDAEINALPLGPAISSGEAVGKAAARAMIAARVGDGADDTSPYTPGNEPGDWRPTGSGRQAVRHPRRQRVPFAAAGRLPDEDGDAPEQRVHRAVQGGQATRQVGHDVKDR
jgi:hypothetical protein